MSRWPAVLLLALQQRVQWTQDVPPQLFIKRASTRSVLLWQAFTLIKADHPTVCVDLLRQSNYTHKKISILIKSRRTCSTEDWIVCTLAHNTHFVFPFRMIMAWIQETTRNCKLSKKRKEKKVCVVTDDLVLRNRCHQLMILEEKQWLKNKFHHAWSCTSGCNQPSIRFLVPICKGHISTTFTWMWRAWQTENILSGLYFSDRDLNSWI